LRRYAKANAETLAEELPLPPPSSRAWHILHAMSKDAVKLNQETMVQTALYQAAGDICLALPPGSGSGGGGGGGVARVLYPASSKAGGTLQAGLAAGAYTRPLFSSP